MYGLCLLIKNQPVTAVNYISETTEGNINLKLTSVSTDAKKEILIFNQDGIKEGYSKNIYEIERDIREAGIKKVRIIKYKNLIIEQILDSIKNKSNSDPISKVEKLLYSQSILPGIIADFKEEIRILEKESKGIEKPTGRSKEIIIDGEKQSYVYADDSLKNRISLLKQRKEIVASQLRLLNKALKSIEEDEYYPLIEEIYVYRHTYEEITSTYGWKQATITNHKNDLLSKLADRLFPTEYIINN